MIIYIPIATGQVIPIEVTTSIRLQSLECDIVICDSPGIINSNHHVINPLDKKLKFGCEGVSRNLCLDNAIQDSNEFFVIQDRDIKHLYNDNIELAVEKLRNNPSVGCVVLSTGQINNHYRNACSVFKKEAVLNFRYQTTYVSLQCHCTHQRYKISGDTVWLDSNKRIEEILVT